MPPASLSGNPLLPDHRGAQQRSKASLPKTIYMLWIEMTDRFLGCSGIFKVNRKKQGTSEMVKNHYPAGLHSLIMLQQPRLGKRQGHMQGGCLCFYACQVRLQLKFHHSIPTANINYKLKPRPWMLPVLQSKSATTGWKNYCHRDSVKNNMLRTISKLTQKSDEELIQAKCFSFLSFFNHTK